MNRTRKAGRRTRGFYWFVALTVTVVTVALAYAADANDWEGLLTSGPSRDDTYTINSYDVHGTLHPDGSLAVVEDIGVTWHDPRMGLIREIDRSTPAGRATITGIHVASDTQDNVWMDIDESSGTTEVHLGEEDDDRPLGQDHYQISYTISEIVAESEGVATLRWDTFGDHWDTDIEHATVTVDVPDTGHTYGCVYGPTRAGQPCDGDDGAWQAERLGPGHGMTVEVQLADGTFDVAALESANLAPLQPEDPAGDQRERRMVLTGALIAAGFMPLLATIGMPRTRRWRRRADQITSQMPPVHGPPSGMNPLTGAKLLQSTGGAASDGHLFSAWLLDAQQRDLIEAAETDKGFQVRWKGEGQVRSPQEQQVLERMVPSDGSWVEWNDKTPSKARKELHEAFTRLGDHHRDEAGMPKYMIMVMGGSGWLLTIALLAVAVGLGAYQYPDHVGAALVLAVGVLLGLAGAALYNYVLRVTVARFSDDQVAAWQQAEGLRTFLREGTADQINQASTGPEGATQQPFYDLLPWVVAFGLGDTWANKFQPQIDQAAPRHVPVYMPLQSSQVSSTFSAASPPGTSGGAGGVGSGGGGGGGGAR